MTRIRFQNKSCSCWLLTAGALLFVCLSGFFSAALAQQAETALFQDSGEVNITADELVVQQEQGWADFLGNVEAKQENTVILSQKIRVWFETSQKKKQDSTDKAPVQDDSIKKIQAFGSVKINSKEVSAVCDEADYTMATQVLELMGTPAIVTRGKSSVSGTRIEWNQKSGEMRVKSQQGEARPGRVKATFSPNEK